MDSNSHEDAPLESSKEGVGVAIIATVEIFEFRLLRIKGAGLSTSAVSCGGVDSDSNGDI